MPGISVQELFRLDLQYPYGQAVAPPLRARSSVSDAFHVEHVRYWGQLLSLTDRHWAPGSKRWK
jgi:hypothetical protein